MVTVATLMAPVSVLRINATYEEAVLRWAARLADRIDCERRDRNTGDHNIGLRDEEE